MVKGVFKIQKPLFSSGDATYLIYNQSRTIMSNNIKVGESPDLDKLFKDVEKYGISKIYVKAKINENNSFEIKDIITRDLEW